MNHVEAQRCLSSMVAELGVFFLLFFYLGGGTYFPFIAVEGAAVTCLWAGHNQRSRLTRTSDEIS